MGFDATELMRRLKDGSFREIPEWREALRDLVVIDQIRKAATPELLSEPKRWVRIVVDLLDQGEPDEIYLALVLERTLVRNGYRESLDHVRALYKSFAHDPFFRFHMSHELLEDDAWYHEHRVSYAAWVRAQRVPVKKVVLDLFGGSETGLRQGMFERLDDVLGKDKGARTQNSPNKAFTYVLYLELLDERAEREAAVVHLPALRGLGDLFFQEVLEEGIKALSIGTAR